MCPGDKARGVENVQTPPVSVNDPNLKQTIRCSIFLPDRPLFMPVLENQMLEKGLFGEEILGSFSVPIEDIMHATSKRFSKFRLKGNDAKTLTA